MSVSELDNVMLQGGKVGNSPQPDKVHLLKIGGREMLWYEAPKRIHVALLRGTSADLDGNISYEREPLVLDNLNQVCTAVEDLFVWLLPDCCCFCIGPCPLFKDLQCESK